MKYEQAINGPDDEAWTIGIDNEHDRIVKNGVFEVVERNKLPARTRPIDSTWACKKKSNGTLRGRLMPGVSSRLLGNIMTTVASMHQ